MLFYFFIILLSIIAFISLIVIPKRQARNVPDIKERIELENKLRATFAQILGGVILLFGIFFAWEELKSTRKFSNETLRVSEQGQITERFTRAIEQLGGDKLAMRLGGIYALERIANDSLKDHWQVMEVLTAYVREMAPLKVEKKKSQINELTEQRVGQSVERSEIGQETLPALDIQAILTVLGRRKWQEQEEEDQRLNLINTDLRNTNLKNADLKNANFTGANLMNADLSGSFLKKAVFRLANLTKAKLYKGRNISNVFKYCSFW